MKIRILHDQGRICGCFPFEPKIEGQAGPTHVVRLFAIGVRFVSRSEAKRLLHGLDRFREVVLDFNGVEGVGQGFADEVFRV